MKFPVMNGSGTRGPTAQHERCDMKRILILAGSALLSMAVAASAATFTVSSIEGTWSGVQDGTNVNGEGTSSVRWGNDVGNGQSGYDFTAAGTPLVNPANPFDIGTFTHLNFPIGGGSSITGATLNVNVIGDVDGTAFNIGGAYAFSHFETPNNGNPCAAGGDQPCPDLVTYLGATLFTDSIIVGGDEFFLSIEGFADGFTFLTAEGQASSATLRAGFTTEPVVNVNPVPLPAGAVLLGTGLAAFGVWGRRKGKRT